MIIKNNTLIFLYFTSLITLTSCPEAGSAFKVTRIIQNETNHQITINVFFKNSGGLLRESLSIEPFEADATTTTCLIERGSLVVCDVAWARDNGSVMVVFDSDRFITYCGESFGCYINDKNIMALDIYSENQSGYIMTEKNTFRFKITEDDYDVAIPIE